MICALKVEPTIHIHLSPEEAENLRWAIVEVLHSSRQPLTRQVHNQLLTLARALAPFISDGIAKESK